MANCSARLALLGLAGLIAGCSSGLGGSGSTGSGPDAQTPTKAVRSGDPVSGDVRFFGYIDAIREPKDNSQEWEARFGRFDLAVPAVMVRDAFKLEPPDTCQTSSRENRIEITDELAFPGYPYQFVDAGNTIRINHASRRYANLSRSAEKDGPYYETTMSGLKASFGKIKLFNVFVRTDKLSAQIPGAVFPSMGPMAVPPVSEVSGFNLDPDDSVSANTVFQWDPGDNPDAMVQISAGGGGRAVFCAAIDDGEFELPAHIKLWLGDKTIPNPMASRESVVFYQTKDALVAVTQSTHY